MNPLRIGFLSTAGIGRHNWKAIRSSGNCVLTAVASRELGRSQAFIADGQRAHPFPQAPMAMGSYEELFASPEVDAIYIPVPTGLRKEWVIKAAEHGKHVICEKPCASTVADLETMLAACQRHGVQFMDGVMFMHNPRLARVREALDDGGSVGAIRRIASAFSFHGGDNFFHENIRADGALEPAGCLGDLGWYCIRFTLWTLKWQLPESVLGRIHLQSIARPGRMSSPTEFSATLFYPDGVTAEFYSSFCTADQQWAHVSGPKGWLRLDDFVHPFNTYEPAFTVNAKVQTVPGDTSCPAGGDPKEFGHATAQDSRMWRHFAEQVATGKRNEEWPMWSLRTQQVLDACLESAKRQAPVKLNG